MNDKEIIQPVPEGVSRPIWSVMIPVYNRTKYVSQAVESVLAQDPGPNTMQICIVDNSTETINWTAVLSPVTLRRIEIFKQPRSVPGHDNWNTCIRKANGHFVHILHDDDWVAQGIYQKITRMSEESPEAGLFAVRSFHVDEHGIVDGVSQRFAANGKVSYDLTKFFPHNTVQCPGVIVKRSVYEVVGGFKKDWPFLIDLEMWMRVVNAFGIRSSDEILSYYRVHNDRGTQSLQLSGQYLRDMLSFCKWASVHYDTLNEVDWLNTILRIARRQELFFRSTGEMNASVIARKFWFENAPLLEKILRLNEESQAFCKKQLKKIYRLVRQKKIT